MIYVNTKDAQREVRQGLQRVTSSVSKALPMALNDTLRTSTTAARREVTNRYNVTASAINRKGLYKQTFARNNNLTAKLDVRNTQLPIAVFKNVRQNATNLKTTKQGTEASSKLSQRNSRTGGVVVTIIKGKRQLIKSAFIQRMKTGHIGVYARGEYGKQFKFRERRVRKTGNDLPIKELNAFNVPTAFLSPEIVPKVERKANETLAKRLKHHLTR